VSVRLHHYSPPRKQASAMKGTVPSVSENGQRQCVEHLARAPWQGRWGASRKPRSGEAVLQVEGRPRQKRGQEVSTRIRRERGSCGFP
jgi:hypothetical protein